MNLIKHCTTKHTKSTKISRVATRDLMTANEENTASGITLHLFFVAFVCFVVNRVLIR